MKVLAIDIGASGGRAMIGSLHGRRIEIQEIHRFSNDPVMVGDTMYWDILRLFHEIKQSLIKSKQYGKVDSIAVDTWGVDFGLLNKSGSLLENPVHYRDKRTKGMLERSFEFLNKEEFYHITGNQFMEINTAFQLLALKEKRGEVLNRAGHMLLIPDLIHYFLTGKIKSEMSIASTTQLFDMNKKTWAYPVIEKLGLPAGIFPELVPSGTVVGNLSKAICTELGMDPVKVTAVCGHDTQSALAATPAKEKDFIFLSCGTWSLMGTELEQPLLNQKAERLNLTNEAGYDGKISLMKNMIGLWLVQESRRQWMREGKELNFGDLEQLAAEAEPFRFFIDPDDPVFTPAGNMPERIRNYCRRTGQQVPESEGEIVRCINESLAMKYRSAREQIEVAAGKKYGTIYMTGGGTKSRLLCAMTANACGCLLSAGPAEATVLGNVAVQLIANGGISSVKDAREMIAHSFFPEHYMPAEEHHWNTAYKRFKEVMIC